MYDGWPPEYDEVVRIDSDRVAPYHTYTWAVKCWVKYKNWPMWPSLVGPPMRWHPSTVALSVRVVWLDAMGRSRSVHRETPRVSLTCGENLGCMWIFWTVLTSANVIGTIHTCCPLHPCSLSTPNLPLLLVQVLEPEKGCACVRRAF